MRRAHRRHKATVVGLGAMGLRHVRVLSALPARFELVGVYDVRGDVELPPQARRLRSEEEAIACAEIVVIATPASEHGATIARALAAGRHVLAEKPLSATAGEAADLAGLSARGAARLFVGHSERCNPVVRALARLARSEPVLSLDFLRVGPSRATDCGVLINLGVHDFDLAAHIARAPVELQAAVGGPVPSEAGLDFAHILLTTAHGAVVHIYVDRTAPSRARAIQVVTPRWFYQGDLVSHCLARTSRATGVKSQVPLVLDEPLAVQALRLADALDGRRAHGLATGDDGARAVALAEAASMWAESSRRGAPPARGSREGG